MYQNAPPAAPLPSNDIAVSFSIRAARPLAGARPIDAPRPSDRPPVAVARVELADVRVSARTVWRHVLLTDAEGHLGVGELSLDDAPADLADRTRAAGDRLLGPRDASAALAASISALDRGLVDATVHSALEQALTDLEAQAAGLPVHALLGATGAPSPVPLYANVNRRTADRSPAGFAGSATKAVEVGFRAVKIAPFDDLTPALDGTAEGEALFEAGLARIEAADAALPPGARLMVDCHWRLTPRSAARALDRLAATALVWFECPLPETPEAVEPLRALRARANGHGVRLAGLETAARVAGFARFVDAGAYDVIMPDVKHAGGHAEILEIARYASERGVAVSLHNPSGPVAHVASLHLAAALDNGEPLEIQFDESPRFDDVTDPSPPAPRDGAATPPASIGLGVTLVRSPEDPAGRGRAPSPSPPGTSPELPGETS